MTDRHGAISTTGVVFAAVGAAVQDYALQILGLLVTVAVHLWTERAKKTAVQTENRELKFWRRKSRSQQHLIGSLQRRLDRAEAAGYAEPGHRAPWEEPETQYQGAPMPLGLLCSPEEMKRLREGPADGPIVPPFPPGEAATDA